MHFSVFSFWNNIFTGGLAQPVACLMENGWKLSGQYSRGNTIIYSYNLNNATIYMFGHVDSHQELMSLYKRADIMVSYSAGEGWDLPCVDAIYMHCDVLATKNTAHKEYSHYFFNELPCEIKLAQDGIWFKGNRGNWYPPVKESRVKKLRNIIENQGDTNKKELSESIASFCSLDKISKSIMDICFS